MSDYLTFILLAPGILAALTVHEFAHGWMANKLGDSTAKDLGRLTLNPLAHLDPIGTIMLFLFHFGWAKPVPVNPYNFKDIRKGMIWVSIAGPGANVVFAAILGVALRILLQGGLITYFTFGYRILTYAVFINLALAFFNMIPIPPLDGSKVVEGMLPVRYLPAWESFQRRGFIILIGIIIIGQVLHIPIFSRTILPLSFAFYNLFTGNAPLAF